MHGPDGVDYPNKSVFLEVVEPEKIVFKHGGSSEGDDRGGASFVSTWTFDELSGKQTRITGRMLFPTTEDRDRVAREYGAVEGGKQTLARLADYLTKMVS
jgi:uncharacterized protein YndB with AHSA1/START domain